MIPDLFSKESLGYKHYLKYNNENHPTLFIEGLIGNERISEEEFNAMGFADILNPIEYEWLIDKKNADAAIKVFQYGTNLMPNNSKIYLYLFDIQKTVDGGFVTFGYTVSNDGDVSINRGNGDCWVVKFTETGIIQWEKTFGGTGHDEANMIKQTNDGNYIFIGYTNFSDGEITFSNGSYDFWIVKIDGIGNILWQKTLGGTDEDYGYSIQQTSDGGF
jgi:hypothetical protein